MGSIFDLNQIAFSMTHGRIAAQASADNEFRKECEELVKHIGEDDGTMDYRSLSAASTSLVSTLQPVSLDPKHMKAYESFFFQKKRHFLLEPFDQAADITNSLNTFFMFMRELLIHGRELFSIGSDTAQVTSRVREIAARAIQFRDTLRTGAKSSVNESMYSLLGSMLNGNKHMIRPSGVYNNGVDIVLAHSSTDSALMCSNIHYGSNLESKADDHSYENNRAQAYLTEMSINVKKAATEIHKFLFGSKSITAHAPVMGMAELSTDFTEIQRILEDNIGIKLGVDFFHNIALTSGVNGNLARRFVQIGLVMRGDQQIGDEFKRTVKRLEHSDLNVDILDHLPKVRDDMEAKASEEARLLNRVFGSTIVFTLDEKVARFISQSTPTEPLSISNIDNWFSIWSSQYLRKKGARIKGGSLTGGRLSWASIPRYVLPVSKMVEISSARKAAGMTAEETRANDDGMYVTPTGTLAYLPTSSDRSKLTTIEEYERLSKTVSDLCAGLSISPLMLTEGYAAMAMQGMTRSEYNVVMGAMQRLKEFEGSILSYDWDFGLRVYASNRPGVVRCEIENGAVRPDSLTLADYLGYNMAKEGEAPLQKTFADSLMLMLYDDPIDASASPSEVFGNGMDPARFIKTPFFTDLIDTYSFHSFNGELPKLEEMIEIAFDQLGLRNTEDMAIAARRGIYDGLITKDGRSISPVSSQAQVRKILEGLISRTMMAVSGKYGSYLYNAIRGDLGNEISMDQLQEELLEHPEYFEADKSPANHFTRIYGFLGGHVLRQILEAINSLPVETLTNGVTKGNATLNVPLPGSTDRRDVLVETIRPNSASILGIVKPLALMFGKYAQNYEQLESEATEAIASIEYDPSIEVDDIHFAGSSEGFSVFPHQLDTHRYLRKPKPPKFAVLDISPGGGKTSLGLGDMAAIVNDMHKVGTRIRPMVMCPDGLVRNWCDDMKAFSNGSWNMIPITSAIYNRWGPDKLADLINKAPINTIVVVGMNFLRNGPMPIVLGNAVVNIGTNLEFIKAFKFNYIIIDESHRLKGMRRTRHKVAKQLTTSSFVEYLRIATGTLIADRVTDIEGQVALYSPHIFRKGELSRSTVSQALDDELKLGDDKVELWKVSTPQRARQRLSRYAAVITKKKKEWAFMLPNPIETFHAVDFTDTESDDADQIRLGELHRQMYDTVVNESVEELEALVSKAKSKSAARSEEDDDDDDDDDEEEGNERTPDLEMDENDELAAVRGDLLDAYIARIERLIITPEDDPLFEEIFGAYGHKTYTSRKARTIAGIVDKHFNPQVWERGTNYVEHDLVFHEGSLYLARKKDMSSHVRQRLDRDTIGKFPNENPEIWKKEPDGKIIIFCRYTNSVNAVYKALPERYQRIAVKYTGQEANKVANLDAFKADPKVQILIANEMGMSEGHNLQMASRMIRVESPWGPGELDQSASRVFRPDPKGAKEGDIYREAVFLDWVLANNTMEVAKQGRLIAKVFNKARFDEAENPRYAGVLSDHMLEEVSMSLSTLQERPSLEDYSAYTDAYKALNAIQRAEFHEMRTTQLSTMIPVPQTAPIEGFETINTPFIASQDIPDPNGWKPVSLAQLGRGDDGKKYIADPQLLVGMPVITDFGNGMIVNSSMSRAKGREGEFTSVGVKLRDSGEVIKIPPSIAFIPTNISSREVKDRFAVSLAVTKADLRKEEKLRKELEELDAQEEAERLARERKEKRQARIRVKSVDAGEKRKRNIRENKPVNQGVDYEPDMTVPTGVKPDMPVTSGIALAPAYYHGYLTLETDDLSAEKMLKKFGFKPIGEYAYVTITRRNQANAVMDYIEDHFDLSNQTVSRLSAVFNAFEKGKRGLYNMELAPVSELPHFFTVRKRVVTNRKEARIYPFFMHDKLMLAIDTATSPIARKHLGKVIPGAATKWQLSPGALMYFAKNKADMKAKVSEIRKAGINISNDDMLKKEIAQINFRAARQANPKK